MCLLAIPCRCKTPSTHPQELYLADDLPKLKGLWNRWSMHVTRRAVAEDDVHIVVAVEHGGRVVHGATGATALGVNKSVVRSELMATELVCQSWSCDALCEHECTHLCEHDAMNHLVDIPRLFGRLAHLAWAPDHGRINDHLHVTPSCPVVRGPFGNKRVR